MRARRGLPPKEATFRHLSDAIAGASAPLAGRAGANGGRYCRRSRANGGRYCRRSRRRRSRQRDTHHHRLPERRNPLRTERSGRLALPTNSPGQSLRSDPNAKGAGSSTRLVMPGSTTPICTARPWSTGSGAYRSSTGSGSLPLADLPAVVRNTPSSHRARSRTRRRLCWMRSRSQEGPRDPL
jgi:hypothetical protein